MLRADITAMLSSLLSMFGQGLLHGLGPDHCLAIGALAAAGGGFRRAFAVSLRFGVGHTAVLAAGAAGAGLAGLAIPARWESALEVVGGVSLLALGCWTLVSRRGAIPHAHGGVVHAHAGGAEAHEGSEVAATTTAGGPSAAVMGAVFGLSGVRGLLLLLPLMGRERAVMLTAGVALFGLGVVASMVLVGWFAQRAADAAAGWERGLRVPVGLASVLCGAWWIVSHV